MARLIYSTIASVDGYIADEQGHFEWAAPDEEVHAFINDLERPIGTYLYGRRMYEVMAVWDNPDSEIGQSSVSRDYAQIWKAADKIVYSRTLHRPHTARTRVEPEFQADAIRRLKASSEHDISIGGPELAGQAIKAGLVDEFQFFLVPVLVGGGKRFLPGDVRIALDLAEERRFAGGTVYLRYVPSVL